LFLRVASLWQVHEYIVGLMRAEIHLSDHIALKYYQSTDDNLTHGPNPLVFVISLDRKSTRLNSSHVKISYAVFCLKKKTNRPIGYVLQIISIKLKPKFLKIFVNMRSPQRITQRTTTPIPLAFEQ